ncbi:MAG TPA: zf-HC2 domain-containing protein [Candidatus Koribacter sp.]|jgi:hypothetical protein
MSENQKFEMQCTDFDVLLTDALDGLLEGERLARFERHRAECAACGLLFKETKSGFDYLHALDEAEPPLNLVHNILAATTAAEATSGEGAAASASRKSWLERLRDGLLPKLGGVMTPRFAMSFGMAFFSVSMLMSVAGVRPTDLRHMDLTPKGIRKAYYETEARATRYYENIRVVYEIQAKVRQLKKAATTPETKGQESKPESKQGNDPARREQNYSRHQNDQILADVVRVRMKDRA